MTQLDPERLRWDQVQRLLDALESIPAIEHLDYLASACPDPELRREVLAMRVAQTESRGYLDDFSAGLGRTPERMAGRNLSGRQVGAYRLVQPLGRGGMGVVYEAERADGAFDQRVALKLLALALTGTEAYERFLAERQILAALEHPAIARIVDGGVTEDGTPWFAMEHIEGEPIDAYSDRHRLGVDERLELFLQVCEAVEHAHRRLVVHRDLKPVNVMVTKDGKVKLLDFGIAKLLDTGGSVQAAPPTSAVQRLMTPEYASPEQVRGEAVTTASDVYQLGLLLYELLTGHRPYVLHGRGGGELERVICDQEPTRLSAAVLREDTLKPSMSATRSEATCRARRTSPRRLQRRLRGDLDDIVVKALSKPPERRYGSADRLAQDVRRHLEGLPVMARSNTWIYRGRKFLDRHAVGASAVVVVLVLATGLTGFHTVRIRSERDRAQAEASKAEQVSQFLKALFRGADPREAQGVELTARELLDRGVEQADRELAGQPDLQAEMLQVLGRTYLELGVLSSAENLLTRAFELRKRRLGSKHADVASSISELGLLLHRQGDDKRARERLNEAIQLLEASPRGDAAELSVTLQRLGLVLRDLGEYDKSRAAFERALAIRRMDDQDAITVGLILNELGVLYRTTGDLERAEAFFNRALAVFERKLGDDHTTVSATLFNLATTRTMQGKLKGVESMLRRNLRIQERAYGTIHRRVGMSLNNLGHFLTLQGRDAEALEVLNRALDIYTSAVGTRHPDVAYPLASLGEAHLAGGRLDEARRYYRRSVSVRDGASASRQFDPLFVYSLVKLGRIEAELGNDIAAERALERALEVWSQAPGSVDSQLAPTLLDLGRWLTERQRCVDALPLLRRAKPIYTARKSTAGAEWAELERLLAGCLGSTAKSSTTETRPPELGAGRAQGLHEACTAVPSYFSCDRAQGAELRRAQLAGGMRSTWPG